MISLRPLHKKIIFVFVEELSSISFMPKSKGGIVLTDMYDYSQVHEPQWGKIVSTGSSVSDEVKNSQYILIAPGKWTTRITLSTEQTVWQTEEDFILAVADDIADTVKY